MIIAPQTEVAKAWPPAEQIGPRCEMRIEHDRQVDERLFQLRNVGFIRAGKAQARHHAADHQMRQDRLGQRTPPLPL